ncbi:MAG: glycosyltransferase family 4 protein [Saccharofermentanales bacterium]
MRVLHINSYYSTRSFYKNLFDQQIDEGLDISVYVPVSTSFDSSKMSADSYLVVSPNHTETDRFTYFLKHKKILGDIVEKFDLPSYNLIHAHSLFSNGLIAMWLKQQFSIPYAVAVRSTDVNVFFKKMFHLRRLGVKIMRSADRVIFLSTSHRDEVTDNYIPPSLRRIITDKTIVVPNGIDHFWLNHGGTPRTLDSRDCIRVLTVGTINKNKNMLTTLKAIKKLSEKGLRVKYTVVGEIGSQSIFKRLCRSPYVDCLAPKPKEELIEVYRNHEIYVMPSLKETFGLVYAEAMSQGLPIIYSKGQGFDGQFAEGVVGYHVDALDPDSIANGIRLAIEHYSELSVNCVRLCKEFEWQKIASLFLSAYSSILCE